jgi:hypothetical protein
MITVGVLGLCLGCTTGCIEGGTGGIFPFGRTIDPAVRAPFAPVHLRVNPLTRVESGQGGRPVLTVYMEVLDAWGHGTKAPGNFRAQLTRVPAGGGLGTLDTEWILDMTDPDQNSSLFDVTGMYRIQLTGAPAWLIAPDSNDQAMRLQVYFSTVGPNGKQAELRDTLQRTLRAKEPNTEGPAIAP